MARANLPAMTPPPSWKVLQHDAIEEFTDNLWRVEGELPTVALRRHMLVVKNDDGRLLIHNGIALDEEGMARLEEWGTPTWLVVPSAFHRMDARRYKDRYPDLVVICPRGARKKVEKVVPVDLTYDEIEGTDTFSLTHLRGLGEVEGVLEVRSKDGVTLIFNDALFNQPHLPGLFGAVYKMLGQTGRPKVTGVTRLFLVKDKSEYAAHLHELSELADLVRIMPGHIAPIVDDARGVLAGVADELAE